jgi:hypothetical protein
MKKTVPVKNLEANYGTKNGFLFLRIDTFGFRTF